MRETIQTNNNAWHTILFSAVLFLTALFPITAAADFSAPKLVSHTSSSPSTPANGLSAFCGLSSDGRFVVFESVATNLVASVAPGQSQIYIHDQISGSAALISAVSGTTLTAGNGASFAPSINADGRYVVFHSAATNLVPGSPTNGTKVFIRDRQTGTTALVKNPDSSGDFTYPDVSSDGDKVVYLTQIAGDVRRVYLTSRAGDTTTQVSGGTFESNHGLPAISQNGRFVIYGSAAADLVAGDTNSKTDVFLFDSVALTTERISIPPAGGQFSLDSVSTGAGSISPDGRYSAFATINVADYPASQVYIRDRQSGTTTLLSKNQVDATQPPDEQSLGIRIGLNGQLAVFFSYASNLVNGSTNWGTFVLNRSASPAAAMNPIFADSTSFTSTAPCISTDGSVVGYHDDNTSQLYVRNADADADGTPDYSDGCDGDAGKTAPGQCGCGVADTDTDSDGTANCHDSCPNDSAKTAAGQCGCGVPDTDTDGDSTADCIDQCDSNPNLTVPGLCGCSADTDLDGVCDTEEVSDGSSPSDSGSYRSHLKTPIYVLWNGFLGVTNIIELFNKSGQTAAVTLTVFDIGGTARQSLVVLLDSQQQFDVIVNDLIGFSANSYGIVKIEFDPTNNDLIDGRVFYYRPGSGGAFDFAYAIPFTKPLYGKSAVGFNTFQPSTDPAESGNLVAQWLSVVNLDTLTRQFNLKKYDQSGTLLATSGITVPPFSRIDVEGGHVVPGPNRVGLNVIEPVSSAAPYQAILLRYGGNVPAGGTPTRYNFAFPLLARAGNGQRQRVPISIGGNAQNWLELINSSAAPISVGMKAYANSGSEIANTSVQLPAFGQQHLNIGQFLSSGDSGSVELNPSSPGSLVGQSMFYFRQSQGGIATMYGSSIRESFGATIYGNYNLYLGMYNWLKLTNLTGSPHQVTLTLYRGAQPISTKTIGLNPFAGIDLGLHDQSVFNTSPDTYGVVKVESGASGVISSELLRLRTINGGAIDYAAPTVLR